jgi:uncharacterized BrkB/YihY/UPF0761 family membrane protein
MRRFAARVHAFYWGAGLADDVPALAYYLVLSLAPFFVGLTALAALIFGGSFQGATITGDLAGFLPAGIRPAIVTLVSGTRGDTTAILAASILAMSWTTSSAIGVIERVLARLLQAPRYPLVLGRLRNLGLGAALGLALTLSMAFASLIGGLGWPQWARDLLPVANFLGAVAFCALIFRLAVRGGVRWSSALAGATVAAVALLVAPVLVGLYLHALAHPGDASVFLSFAIVLLGFYLVAVGLLVGAGTLARVERAAQP